MKNDKQDSRFWQKKYLTFTCWSLYYQFKEGARRGKGGPGLMVYQSFFSFVRLWKEHKRCRNIYCKTLFSSDWNILINTINVLMGCLVNFKTYKFLLILLLILMLIINVYFHQHIRAKDGLDANFFFHFCFVCILRAKTRTLASRWLMAISTGNCIRIGFTKIFIYKFMFTHFS